MDNMKGREMNYSSNVSNLKWNDQMSSLSCQCSDPPTCAVVFQHSDYKGKKLSIPSGTSWDDLDTIGWNDAASSLKVNPNCIFKGYEQDNMKGREMKYFSNVSNLGRW